MSIVPSLAFDIFRLSIARVSFSKAFYLFFMFSWAGSFDRGSLIVILFLRKMLFYVFNYDYLFQVFRP